VRVGLQRPRIVGMVASPMTYKVLESKCQAYGFKADLVLADSVEAGSISQVWRLRIIV